MSRLLLFAVCLSLAVSTLCSPIESTTPFSILSLSPQKRIEMLQNLTDSVELSLPVNRQDAVKQLLDYYLEIDLQTNAPQLSAKVKGWFSFVNVLWFISICTAIPTASLIFVSYFLPLLILIPAIVWEFIGYLGMFSMLYWSFMTKNPVTKEYIALTACLSLLPLLAFSQHLHKILERLDWKDKKDLIQRISLFLFLVWSPIAIFLPSSVVGGICVVALVSYLGFSIAVEPFTVYIGFQDKDSVHACMSACLLLMVITIVARLVSVPFWLQPFCPGVDLLCVLAYSIGHLIISTGNYIGKDFNDTVYNLNKSRREALIEAEKKRCQEKGIEFDEQTIQWDHVTEEEYRNFAKRHRRRYHLQQLYTLVALLSMLAVGNILDISSYRNIASTIGLVWVLEKYVEFTWKRGGMLWSSFGLSILVWFMSYIIQSYPGYFFGLAG